MPKASRHAVLYLSPLGRVTGSLIDSLEYLIALKQAGVGAQLVYMGKAHDLPRKLIEDRYDLNFDPLADALFLRYRWHLARHRFDRVLMPYTTFRRIAYWLKAGETFVLPSMWMRRDAGRLFGWPRERGKVTYLLNPKQHDYTVKNWQPYEKKLLLDSLKKPAASKAHLLVNCESSHKRHSPERIRQAAQQAGPFEKINVLASGKHAQAYQQAGFNVLSPPIENLFAQYNQYLYLPPIDGYDENPRLLIESAWLGKDILFGESPSHDAYAREKYQRLKTDINPFRLTQDDWVVQQFAK